MVKANRPLISIITVTYNAADTLPATIKSVLSQTYDSLEFIIVDGGSTDGTLKLIEQYSHRVNKWVSEPDRGVYDAMNKAVNLASGDWLFFLGAGDLLYDSIHLMAPGFSDHETIYYGNVYRKDLGMIYDGRFSSVKLTVKNICHQAIFYPARAFQKYRYEDKYKVFADHVLNIKLFGDHEFKFVHLPVSVSEYEGGGFSHVTADPNFVKDRLSLIKDNLPRRAYVYAWIRNKIAKLLKAGSHRIN